MEYEFIEKADVRPEGRRQSGADWVSLVRTLPPNKVAKIKCENEADIARKQNSVRVAGYRLGILLKTSSRILNGSYFLLAWRK